MQNLDHLQAFVSAAECGSFSAAARYLGKAQSAISTAVMNLEVDMGVELFDRSSRSPVLTERGKVLLKYAQSVLRSQQELMAIANSLAERQESHLGFALEQGTYTPAVAQALAELQQSFPYLEVEVFDPGAYDVAELMHTGRADIGLMSEQESYPQGFHFKGVGHSLHVPVCAKHHPLASKSTVTHQDLREYHQFVLRSRFSPDNGMPHIINSPQVWYSESPYLIVDMVLSGLGWTVIPWSVAAEKLPSGDLVQMHYAFQQSPILQGIDLVWTEQRPLGAGGLWLQQRLQQLGSHAWLPDNWTMDKKY